MTLPLINGKEKIGLFGGSFNPPHEGHNLVAKTALSILKLDQLWWMVTPKNPLKENINLPSVEERVKESAERFSDPKIIFTGFEEEINSYKTYETLRYILKYYKTKHFVWIMGSDSLVDFHKWEDWQKIAELIPLAIIDRPTALNAWKYAEFAKKYEQFRLKEDQAERLAFYKPPAWCYIHGILCDQSSTKLRNENIEK